MHARSQHNTSFKSKHGNRRHYSLLVGALHSPEGARVLCLVQMSAPVPAPCPVGVPLLSRCLRMPHVLSLNRAHSPPGTYLGATGWCVQMEVVSVLMFLRYHAAAHYKMHSVVCGRRGCRRPTTSPGDDGAHERADHAQQTHRPMPRPVVRHTDTQIFFACQINQHLRVRGVASFCRVQCMLSMSSKSDKDMSVLWPSASGNQPAAKRSAAAPRTPICARPWTWTVRTRAQTPALLAREYSWAHPGGAWTGIVCHMMSLWSTAHASHIICA